MNRLSWTKAVIDYINNKDYEKTFKYLKTLGPNIVSKKPLQKITIANSGRNQEVILGWISQENTLAVNNPTASTHIIGRINREYKTFNSKNVRSYKQINFGYYAFYRTLTNGQYQTIINAFNNNKLKNHEVALIIKKTAWGTWHNIEETTIKNMFTVNSLNSKKNIIIPNKF